MSGRSNCVFWLVEFLSDYEGPFVKRSRTLFRIFIVMGHGSEEPYVDSLMKLSVSKFLITIIVL